MTTIINNTAIEYRDDGRGPVMLMLHGWGDSLSTFDALVKIVSEKFRVVRLDLPGHGRSQPPAQPWTIDDFVGLVAAFIEKLNLDVDVLVGHSFGGRIIIKGLSQQRLQPRKAVLIAAAGVRRSPAQRWPLTAAAKLGKLLTAIPPLRPFRQRLRAKLYQQAGSEYLDAGNLQPTFLNIVREDLTAAAKDIGCPTLLLWGDRDSATPLTDGRRLATLISGSRLTIIPGATHFVHQEQSERIAAEIMKFDRPV